MEKPTSKALKYYMLMVNQISHSRIQIGCYRVNHYTSLTHQVTNHLVVYLICYTNFCLFGQEVRLCFVEQSGLSIFSHERVL
jgi:hypothetical protein